MEKIVTNIGPLSDLEKCKYLFFILICLIEQIWSKSLLIIMENLDRNVALVYMINGIVKFKEDKSFAVHVNLLSLEPSSFLFGLLLPF